MSVNLLNKCYDRFSGFMKFWPVKEMSHWCQIYEESDYSEENKSDNEDFCSTIFQSFQFEPEWKKTW